MLRSPLAIAEITRYLTTVISLFILIDPYVLTIHLKICQLADLFYKKFKN